MTVIALDLETFMRLTAPPPERPIMTNQQAPEIYTLHTILNKGERPWSGIYGVRADAEHDAKVMRDVTGRHWSVVRLVVADTAAPQPSPTPQADSQPAADEDIAMSRTQDLAESGRWPSDWVEAYRRGYSDRAARALADSVTAPAGGGAVVEWHAPGLGEVHNESHDQMIFCTDGDDVADDTLARRVCAALNATPPAQAADSVLEDAAQESEYRRGYRHGYEQRDAEVRGALA